MANIQKLNGLGQWRQSLTAPKKYQFLHYEPIFNAHLPESKREEERPLNIPATVKHWNIGDGLRRLFNARSEQRIDSEAQTATLNHRGHRHVVRVANISASGAMIIFAGDLAAGDEVELHLLDQGPVRAQARWVRDDRVGISFTGPAGQELSD